MSDPNANKVNTRRQIRRRPIEAKTLTMLGEATNAQSRSGPGPVTVTPQQPVVQRFRIIEIQHADHLVCQIWNGQTLEDRRVNVAKPPGLRGTTTQFNEAVYSEYSADYQERTSAVPGLDDEVQVITPPYILQGLGDAGSSDIYAIRTGFTGVEVDGAQTEWLDLNVSGRAWAKKST